MPEFAIPLADLESVGLTGKDFDFAVSPAWAGRQLEGSELRWDEAVEAGKLHIHAQLTGRDVLVMGRLQGGLLTDCCRCLEPVKLPVDAEITVLFHPGPPEVRGADGKPAKGEKAHKGAGKAPARESKDAKAARELEEDLDLEGPDSETYQGDKVVLDGLVREYLELEMPMQPLCREDCPGIEIPEHLRPPPDFGRESDIDPRLLPLMKLAKGDKKQ